MTFAISENVTVVGQLIPGKPEKETTRPEVGFQDGQETDVFGADVPELEEEKWPCLESAQEGSFLNESFAILALSRLYNLRRRNGPESSGR